MGVGIFNAKKGIELGPGMRSSNHDVSFYRYNELDLRIPASILATLCARHCPEVQASGIVPQG